MVDFDKLVQEGEQLAQEHPEQAREAVDKIENVVDEKTGGKFNDQVSQGGDFLENKLGIQDQQAGDQQQQ